MSLSGATVCITGTLSIPRKNFESMLRQHGANVVPSLTKSCSHLVCSNDDDGSSSKSQKALARGVCILSEAAVWAMIAPEQQAQQNEKIGKEPASKKVKLTTADIADGESVPVYVL
jgi:hypothetical protein